MKIPVILGSTREERKSDRVAQYLVRTAGERGLEARLVDLARYEIPWLESTYPNLGNPSSALRELHEVIVGADGLVIVSPEYNGQMPGSLKNALDHFYPEDRRKPIGSSTVSAGDFAGVHVMNQLRLWAVRVQAIPTAVAFNVPRVTTTFTDDAAPADSKTAQRAERFFDDLIWYVEAVGRQLRTEEE